MLAECSEGAGAKDFFDWLTPLREGHLDQSLREAFTIAGYIFYAACENIRKANILLLAGPKLDARIVNDMGIRKYDRMEDIMADVDIKGKMFTSSLTAAASCLRRKPITPVSAQKSKYPHSNRCIADISYL